MSPIARFWRGIVARVFLGVVLSIAMAFEPWSIPKVVVTIVATLLILNAVAGLIGYASMIQRTKGMVRANGSARNDGP